MKKEKPLEFIPTIAGEPIFKMKEQPQELGDLQPEAIKTLSAALGRVDKTGLPDKIAVDAAKFVSSASGAKDSNEYKKMLQSFRELVVSTRKNKGVEAEKTIELEEKERQEG